MSIKKIIEEKAEVPLPAGEEMGEALLATGEKLRSTRTDLGLTQREFALLLGVKPLTVKVWERAGLQETRGGAHQLFLALEAMLDLADSRPDLLNPDVFRETVRLTAQKRLAGYFLRTKDDYTSGFLRLVCSGHLVGALAALLCQPRGE